MALYQPTNVIPSSYTKGTVDAVNDKMEISWQVNGNSAMTAFQIDFYLNDANSTPVTGTGKKGTTPEEQKQLGLPFYGTDRFGRPQFFTWNADDTWNNFNSGFTNGNEYKYKITQWYKGENRVLRCQANVALLVGNTYYFKVPDSNAIVYFSVSSNLVAGTNDIYYSYTNNDIWVDNRSRIVLCSGNYVENGTIPNGAIEVMGEVGATTLDELFVSQTSSNIVVTRDKPTLTIYRSNEQYTYEIDFPNNGSITTSIGFFKAVYTQLQSDPIRWIRWQVATANNGNVGEILADTGDIYTPTLNYEYNGFFNGQQYAIRAICESESGQSCDSGWILFTINIENQGEYSGEFTVQCLNKENATLLEWEAVEVIPPTVSPQGYEPQISNGSVTLLPKNGDTEYLVAWDKKIVVENGESENIPIEFPAPWAAVWKGKMDGMRIDILSYVDLGDSPQSFAFSPISDILAVTTDTMGYIYRVSGDALTLLTSMRNGQGRGSSFSPDGHLLVMGNYLYKVAGYEITELSYLVQGTPSFTSAFSPDGKLLIIGGWFSGFAKLFLINGESATFLYNLTKNGEPLAEAIFTSAFSPDGKLLIIGGNNRKISVFSIQENTATFLYDYDIAILPTQVLTSTFSPDGKLLAIGTNAGMRFFSVTDTNIIFISRILDDLIVGGFFDSVGDYYYAFAGVTVYTMSVKNNTVQILGSQVLVPNRLTAVAQKDETIAFGSASSVFLSALNTYLAPQGKVVELKIGDNALSITRTQNVINIEYDTVNVNFETIKNVLTALIITPNNVIVYFYDDNGLISQYSTPIAYTQQPITSVSIYGGDSGATVDSVSVYKGDGSNILPLYQNNPNFEPVWNSNDYDLYMTANFNGNLEGGTGTATGSGFRVYRQEVGKNVLTPIATVPSTTTSVKDYGIVSGKAYKYSLYAYDNNGAFMNSVENEKVIATCFKNYSLLVCDYDEANDEYHVRKQYLFALNLSTGSVGNNNSPTLNANFTRYPTRMPSTQNYASGTLSGLIGAIYTVPALIEQIGNYKWTTKPSTLDYFDSVDLEQELYDLSTAPYQLFLRDMKGRLRMVHTSAPITMTTNIKQKQQSISMSLPWVEIGDASDVTIIQTPEDYGWNNDNQVLDVSLDVDVETGELSATYPFPYNGTKFYLTGVNKETLTAKTPLGITPAQFELSETATQPQDGQLKASVKVLVPASAPPKTEEQIEYERMIKEYSWKLNPSDDNW